MKLSYEDYVSLRSTIVKTQRPSVKRAMLDRLATLYPDLHFQMCMGRQLMRDTSSVQQEVCHV